jgi:hypothetical protein
MTQLVIALALVSAVVTAVALIIVGLGITLVIGMRTGNPRILRTVRNFNKAVTNPRQLRIAGKRGAQMSILFHRGRISGREYATPIGATATADGGFVVALPYGPGTDWLRNLRAADSAVLRTDGFDYRVDQPQIVSIESTPLATEQAAARRLFGVTSALRLRAVRVPPPAERGGAARLVE